MNGEQGLEKEGPFQLIVAGLSVAGGGLRTWCRSGVKIILTFRFAAMVETDRGGRRIDDPLSRRAMGPGVNHAREAHLVKGSPEMGQSSLIKLPDRDRPVPHEALLERLLRQPWRSRMRPRQATRTQIPSCPGAVCSLQLLRWTAGLSRRPL